VPEAITPTAVGGTTRAVEIRRSKTVGRRTTTTTTTTDRIGGTGTTPDCLRCGWRFGTRASRDPRNNNNNNNNKRDRPGYRCPVRANRNSPGDRTGRWTCTPVPDCPCPTGPVGRPRGFPGAALATLSRRRRERAPRQPRRPTGGALTTFSLHRRDRAPRPPCRPTGGALTTCSLRRAATKTRGGARSPCNRTGNSGATLTTCRSRAPPSRAAGGTLAWVSRPVAAGARAT